MENSRMLSYFQNYDKFSKFASIYDVFEADESATDSFKSNISTRSAIRNAFRLPKLPVSSPQRGERITTPEHESYENNEEASESQSRISRDDNSLHDELVWKDVDPVATPKSRKSIITSTRIGEQIFGDQTNIEPYETNSESHETVSKSYESSDINSLSIDRIMKVGVDRQVAEIGEIENILTLTTALTQTPISGFVNPESASEHEFSGLNQMKSAAGKTTVEDVCKTRSSASPPADKLRRISSRFANRLVNYSKTMNESNSTGAESIENESLTPEDKDNMQDITVTRDYDRHEQRTCHYNRVEDTSCEAPHVQHSTLYHADISENMNTPRGKANRKSDTTYTPGTTDNGSHLVSNTLNLQQEDTLIPDSTLVDPVQKETNNVTVTLERVESTHPQLNNNDTYSTTVKESNQTDEQNIDNSTYDVIDDQELNENDSVSDDVQNTNNTQLDAVTKHNNDTANTVHTVHQKAQSDKRSNVVDSTEHLASKSSGRISEDLSDSAGEVFDQPPNDDAYDVENIDADTYTMQDDNTNNSVTSSQRRKSRKSSTRTPPSKAKASISLRRKSVRSSSKVIVSKKVKSRYSVYDPEMPSISSSPQHYGHTTRALSTPRVTRAKNRGLKGEKLGNMYNSPHLLKPHVTPNSRRLGLRRSKRTKLPPLRQYAGETAIYEFDDETKTFQIAGVNKPDPRLDFIFHHRSELNSKKKKKPTSKKKQRKELTLHEVDSDASFSDGEVEIFDGEDEKAQVITNNGSEVVLYDLGGGIADDDAPVSVSKLLQNEITSCGDVIIKGLNVKPSSQLNGFTVTFTVNEGAVMLTINNKIKKVLQKGACVSIPDGNTYEVRNLRQTTAKLFYVASRVG